MSPASCRKNMLYILTNTKRGSLLWKMGQVSTFCRRKEWYSVRTTWSMSMRSTSPQRKCIDHNYYYHHQRCSSYDSSWFYNNGSVQRRYKSNENEPESLLSNSSSIIPGNTSSIHNDIDEDNSSSFELVHIPEYSSEDMNQTISHVLRYSPKEARFEFGDTTTTCLDLMATYDRSSKGSRRNLEQEVKQEQQKLHWMAQEQARQEKEERKNRHELIYEEAQQRRQDKQERHLMLQEQVKEERNKSQQHTTTITTTNNVDSQSSWLLLKCLVDARCLPGPLEWEFVSDSSSSVEEIVHLKLGEKYHYEIARTTNFLVKRRQLQHELATNLLQDALGHDWQNLTLSEMKKRLEELQETIVLPLADTISTTTSNNNSNSDDVTASLPTTELSPGLSSSSFPITITNNIQSQSPLASLQCLIDAKCLPISSSNISLEWEFVPTSSSSTSTSKEERVRLLLGEEIQYELVRPTTAKRKTLRQMLATFALWDTVGRDWHKMTIDEMKRRMSNKQARDEM